MPNFKIICLGVGKGDSYVMRGITSTSFALAVDDTPYLLIDCGAGVAMACHKYLGQIPETIYITHNHLDHTGDLPVAQLYTKNPPTLIGHPDVLDLVKEHRLHDAPEIHQQNMDRISWVTPDENSDIYLAHDLKMSIFRSLHTYTCYGFMLFHKEQLILGYSADMSYDKAIYKKITRAPVAVIDGREKGDGEHASFEDIDAFAVEVPNCQIYVVHYEHSEYTFVSSNVRLWRESEQVVL